MRGIGVNASFPSPIGRGVRGEGPALSVCEQNQRWDPLPQPLPHRGRGVARRACSASPIAKGEGARGLSGLIRSLSFVLAAGIVFTLGACASPSDVAERAIAEAEFESGMVQLDPNLCRPSDFRGCCSKNGGLNDLRTGLCESGTISETCETRWGTSLQGLCGGGAGGIKRVTREGLIECIDGRKLNRRIPKCPADKG